MPKKILIFVLVIFFIVLGFFISNNLLRTTSEESIVNRLFPVSEDPSVSRFRYFFKLSQSYEDYLNILRSPLFQGGISDISLSLTNPDGTLVIETLTNPDGTLVIQTLTKPDGTLYIEGLTNPVSGLPIISINKDPKVAELKDLQILNKDLVLFGKGPVLAINEFFENESGEVFTFYLLQRGNGVAKIIDYRWVSIEEWNTYPDCNKLDQARVPYYNSTIEYLCKSNGVLRYQTNSRDKELAESYLQKKSY
jgi:hypothetical protein